mgnify:CR=1 FL=1
MKTSDRLCVAVGAGLLASSALLSIPTIRATMLRVETGTHEVSRPNPALAGVSASEVDRLSQALRDVRDHKPVARDDLEALAKLRIAHEDSAVSWNMDGLRPVLITTEHDFKDMRPRALIALGACSGLGAALLAWGLVRIRSSP